MSVNITKHGTPRKSRNSNILLDPERTKKENFDERRKQRLLQVRSQSKELASKVRQNVNLETKKQLKRIEQLKEEELKNSKRKQKTDNDIIFFEFGEAHRAASMENRLNAKRPSCPITHNRNFPKRNSPKNNKNLDKENSSYNANTQQGSHHIYPNVLIGNKKSRNIESEEESSLFESPKKSHNSPQILGDTLKNLQSTLGGCCFLPICCCCHPILTCQCHVNANCNCINKNKTKHKSDSAEEDDRGKQQSKETISTTSIISTSSETKPIPSYDSFKKRQQQRLNIKKIENTKKLTKTPSVIMEVSSEDSDSLSSSSSCTIADTHSNTNMQFSRVYSRRMNKTSNIYNTGNFPATTDPSSESLTASRINKRQDKFRHYNLTTSLPGTSKLRHSVVPANKSHISNIQYPSPDDMQPSTSNGRIPSRARFTQISELLKEKTVPQNIPNDHINDKATQMSPSRNVPNIPYEGIAKDFCTRGILVDSNELAQNQYQKQKNVTKNILESDNSKIQQVQKNKEKPKTPRLNLNIGKKMRETQLGELLGPKSILSSKTTIPKETEKVQYYDYNNRFQKHYQPKFSNLIQNERDVNQLNAMENADIERQLQKSKDNDLEILRKKSEERCQEAIEREQVRRDYEALQAKLDALSMDKKSGRIVSQSQDENIFSDIRLKQLATVRQNKINNAVENILQQPIVITCPEVNTNLPLTSSNQKNKIKSYDENNQNGINLANNYNIENILNSSDSCSSILINYVDKKSAEISNDIKISNNNEKNCKLKSLLNRLNALKSDLLKELQSNENTNQNSTVDNAFGAINEVHKEHENIMTNRDKKNLEKREKKLKKQEAILEKKLKEFFEMQKSTKKQISDKNKLNDSVQCIKNSSTEESTESSIYLETKTISTKVAKQPIEIIIQVSDKNKKTIKSPCRTPRQRASLIDPLVKRRKKNITQNISTPIRLDSEEIKIIEQHDENNSQTTSSTCYRALPEHVENNLNKLLNEHSKQQEQVKNISEENRTRKEHPKKVSTTKRTLTPKKLVKKPTTTSKISDKKESVKHCNSQVISQPLQSDFNQSGKPINPILGHYIQRLLGMSRQSINMLGVSSSTVTTPSSSLFNNSANKSNGFDSNFEKERIERLQRFIDDNYSFLSELEESLKPDRSTNSSDASQKAIAEIWKKTLKQKSENNINKVEDSEKKPTKPILKKSSTITKTSIENDNSKLEVLGKYTELTATCAQRISELNEMINRVRQEKQKILEITLSSNSTSNSENGKNSTEYLEFADRQKKQQQQQSQLSTGGRTYVANGGSHDNSTAPQILNNENLDTASAGRNISGNLETNVPVPEIDICENAQLEKNKLTGISRDSGISLSRPVTALGSRDSPDTRRDSKSEDTAIFEPLLKDIPKPNATNLLPCKSHLTTVISDKLIKKSNKPPVALNRFSPQLIEEIPHELSTIIEIDTPGTSHLNAITKHLSTDENIKIPEENEDQILPLHNSKSRILLDDIEIDFKKFPTFEEYAKKHNLDLTNFDSELNSHMQKEYKKLLELTQSLKEIDYNEYYKNAKNELQDIISISDICDDPNNEIELINSEESLEKIKQNFIKFPTAKEYFKKVGAKDFINSLSLDNVSIATNDVKTISDEKCVLISSGESLPDVNAELKRRNVMQHSFINQYENSDDKDKTSDELNSLSSGSKDNNKKSQNNKIDKCPMSGVEQLTSTVTTTTTGKTEEIEKDLENMGMKWAQVMLQKTHRSQALSSSTTSSFLFEKHLRPSPFRKNITGDFAGNQKLKSSTRLDMEKEIDDNSDSSVATDYGGKPINLREFLTQELQKRTNSSTTTSSSADDSMVNLFLRSLLGDVTPSSLKQTTTTDRRQKTSTPVDTLSKSQSTSIKNNSKINHSNSNTNDSKLFSSESHISSVRFSRSDCEKSINDNLKK